MNGVPGCYGVHRHDAQQHSRIWSLWTFSWEGTPPQKNIHSDPSHHPWYTQTHFLTEALRPRGPLPPPQKLWFPRKYIKSPHGSCSSSTAITDSFVGVGPALLTPNTIIFSAGPPYGGFVTISFEGEKAAFAYSVQLLCQLRCYLEVTPRDALHIHQQSVVISPPPPTPGGELFLSCSNLTFRSSIITTLCLHMRG